VYVAPFGSRKNKKKEIIIIIIIIVTIVKTFCAAKVIRIFVVLAVYYYYYYYYYLSPLCRVFTILHPKQTVFYHLYAGYLQFYTRNKPFLWKYIILQMFCIYSVCDTSYVISYVECFVLWALVISPVRVQCPMWLFL